MSVTVSLLEVGQAPIRVDTGLAGRKTILLANVSGTTIWVNPFKMSEADGMPLGPKRGPHAGGMLTIRGPSARHGAWYARANDENGLLVVFEEDSLPDDNQ